MILEEEEIKTETDAMYSYLTKYMTAEEALRKFLSSPMLTYKRLKFDDKDSSIHPEIILGMASYDMGMNIHVEKNDSGETIGFVIGKDDFIKKNKKTKK